MFSLQMTEMAPLGVGEMGISSYFPATHFQVGFGATRCFRRTLRLRPLCWGIQMHRLTVIVVAGMLIAGAQAFAAAPKSQAAMNRRQLADCMNKRMASDKAISYNEAAKVCKVQMKAQNNRAAISTPTTQANAH